MINTAVRYGIALHSFKQQFNRARNIVVHHGLMGSAKNFRTIAKMPSISLFANSHLIDARNHGNSPHTSTHTMQDLADDLFQYISTTQLLEKGKLTLMGHSMGGLTLMEFTRKYCAPQIQSQIDRVIIIDIPASPPKVSDPSNQTGQMLKKMLQIDLTLSAKQIGKQIEKRALTKDIAGLLKGSIVHDGRQYRWIVNLPLLANEGYENITNYSLLNHQTGKWKKPVDLIYGQKSNYRFDEKEKQIYCKYYPQMEEQNFHRIDNAGHWVHFQNTKQFLEKMKIILQRDGPPQQ